VIKRRGKKFYQEPRLHSNIT